MRSGHTTALEQSINISEETSNAQSGDYARGRSARKKLLAAGLLALLVPVAIWQRGAWANAYARSQMKRELTAKGTDYRAVATLKLRRGSAQAKYPYYWDRSGSSDKVALSFPRYTGSMNEMVFEALPESAEKSRSSKAIALENASTPVDLSFKSDTTLDGEIMDIYRYGTGKPEVDGYREYIVAIFPKRALKVTIVQWYKRGPYVEDDVAMNRMLNVLYGVKFD